MITESLLHTISAKNLRRKWQKTQTNQPKMSNFRLDYEAPESDGQLGLWQ